jgi:hypothetical protein
MVHDTSYLHINARMPSRPREPAPCAHGLPVPNNRMTYPGSNSITSNTPKADFSTDTCTALVSSPNP